MSIQCHAFLISVLFVGGFAHALGMFPVQIQMLLLKGPWRKSVSLHSVAG